MGIRTLVVTAENIEDIQIRINQTLKDNHVEDKHIMDISTSRQMYLAERSYRIEENTHKVMQERWTVVIIVNTPDESVLDTSEFAIHKFMQCICCDSLEIYEDKFFWVSPSFTKQIEEDKENIAHKHKGLCNNCYESNGYYKLLMKILCNIAVK